MNTEITLPVPELKNALHGLNKLIGKKTTLPVLGCVRVQRQKNGLVSLQGTDLGAFATYTLEGTQPGEPVDLLVPVEQLNKACKCSGTTHPVALVCEGKAATLRYHLGGCPLNLTVNPLPIGEWPIPPSISTDSSPLPPGFGEALKQAMTCCSEDYTRQVLRGACLDARDAKAHYIVGTNGRFLFSANSFTFPFKNDIIVPDSKFLTGSGLLDSEPCFIAIQPGKKRKDTKHISIKTKQWDFVTRAIDGNYPNWKQVIPKIDGAWTMVKFSDQAVEQMLKVIPNLPGQDTDHHTIQLRITDKFLFVEGRNKEDKDWTSICITEVNIKGRAKQIALNRDYLLPALKFGLKELAVLDELTPMVCSNEGKRMVIMPVNLKGPQVQAPQPSASTPPTEAPKLAEPKESTMPKATTSKPEVKSEPSPSLIDQIEKVKESAKSLVRDLASLTDVVKQMEKDKRANEKELDNARAVLKKLQQVTI